MFDERRFASAPSSQYPEHDRSSTFCAILRKRAAETPEKIAFAFLDPRGAAAEEMTFAALDQRAHAIASHLVMSGLQGQRVLLMFPPGLNFVTALFGCFYAGAVAVPVPFLSGKRVVERLHSIVRDSEPAGVLTLGSLREESQLRETCYAVSPNLVWIQIDAIDRGIQLASLPATKPDTLALLQYTSGSTASPKGVMLSHANLTANSAMIAETFGHDETLRGVGWLPLFHDMGLVGHVLQPVYVGGFSALMSPLLFLQRPSRWLQAISDWKATTSGGPSYAFDLCVKSIRDDQLENLDLSSWRVAYCGAEKVRADVLERFSDRFAKYGFQRRALLPCFGLAEASLLVTGARRETGINVAEPARDLNRWGSAVNCGPAGCRSSVIIVNPDTRMTLTEGVVGEIWVQGPHVAQGYWRQSNADESFCARLIDGSGPYLRTGDLGFIQDNDLFVVGRIKNTIIVNGLKHCAEDIEATVMRSHPLFEGLAAAAFGIDDGGHERTIVVQEIARDRLKSPEVGAAVANALSSVSRDHGLRLFDLTLVRAGSLPRTTSGKIMRAAVRDRYLANDFERLNPPHALFATAPAGAHLGNADG